ncbi:MAG: phosphoribosylformylglycinamidine synthase subunit PurS, partial [Anaerolineae bacterium]|nr:phosphoribosylformylglycinamidine synthase subunit PurS [Anaerolineae bacterium]
MKISDVESSVFRIEVMPRSEAGTGSAALVNAAHQSGITELQGCIKGNLFFVQGHLDAAEVERLAQELLADPVTESFTIMLQDPTADPPIPTDAIESTIEVTLLPGVTDPAAENLVRAAHLLGLTNLSQAATGQFYRLTGTLSDSGLHRLAVEIFSNPVIQRFTLNKT